MKRILKQLYQALPVIRELNTLKELTRQQNRLLEINGRATASCAVIQAMEILKASQERYRDPKRLLVYGAQFWSQNYEDGMIAEVFRRIGVTSRTFLEIGTGDGSENNTTVLLSAGWSGWWVEGSPRSCDSIKNRLLGMPALAARLKLKQAFVSPENISSLLAELKVPREVDLFSLDIDLNTYHIWAALGDFRPRVVIVEYNAGIPPNQAWIRPYDADGEWDLTADQGASLKAYELLGQRLGYSLVGCDLTGINAIFVRSDLVGDNFLQPFTAENHYEPARHGAWSQSLAEISAYRLGI